MGAVVFFSSVAVIVLAYFIAKEFANIFSQKIMLGLTKKKAD